jgi:hypothetical protein
MDYELCKLCFMLCHHYFWWNINLGHCACLNMHRSIFCIFGTLTFSVSEVCKFGIWCSVMKPHVQISLHYFTSSQGRGILCDYHNQMEIKRLIGSIRRQLHLQQWGRDLLLENRVTPAPGLTIMSEKTIVLSSEDEEDDNHCWPSKLSGRLFPLSFIYYYLFQNIRSFIYVLSSMFSTDPSSRLFVVPFWSTVWFMV